MTTSTQTSDSPPQVHGLTVTPTTQCAHYYSLLDIIAIKHPCCSKFYACISCHNALENHQPVVWPRSQRDEKVVLCGACGKVLTIEEYMGCGSKCIYCGKGFNPGCRAHWELYFELTNDEIGMERGRAV
ncbi:hypothetical protein K469DRAFT_564019 [Zopfia rhizophila CBS 207.26]|uniref:CHY-type domain-containing protein n=1 Tax=Zopfia rhizophila CBS 207.26 TaxID=1314779 RepID=A0A6A6EB59_9PEZI|nr:hypothetical protein K469DRAFT_564019 [Zopfia rhizophila CBS 207.26]